MEVSRESIIQALKEVGFTKSELEKAGNLLTNEETVLIEAKVNEILERYKRTDNKLSNSKKLIEDPPLYKDIGHLLQDVRSAAVNGEIPTSLRTYQKYWSKALNTSVGSEGGFLIAPEYTEGILANVYDTGALLKDVRKIPITSNRLVMRAIDETSRASSRLGGLTHYWIAEESTITASQFKFRQIEWVLKKIAVRLDATEELLQDASALTAFINVELPKELIFGVENAIIRGSGAGQPLGILNSGALIEVAKESGQAADTFVTENADKMFARMPARLITGAKWYINQEVWVQLFSLNRAVGTAGGLPVFQNPQTGISAAPFGSIHGRPIQPLEYCSALGDAGDVIFANMGEYTICDNGGIKGSVSIHVLFLTDKEVFKFIYRVDGQPVWNSALTPYKGSATQSPYITIAERA